MTAVLILGKQEVNPFPDLLVSQETQKPLGRTTLCQFWNRKNSSLGRQTALKDNHQKRITL